MIPKQQELEDKMKTAARAEANKSMVHSTIHRRFTMKRFIIAVMFAATAVSAQPTFAISIDTTGSDVGTIFNFGAPDSATYGQTFTVSGPDTQLDSFSLYLRDRYDGTGTLDLRGYVASWDSVNFRANNLLFESATQTMNADGTLQEFAFSPAGGLGLTAGQQYVAFLSISNLTSQLGSTFGMPNAGSVLSGGQFVFQNNGTEPFQLFLSPWSTFVGPQDVWFKTSLSNPSAVPEPASLMLLGAGLAGIGIWRRKAAKG